MANPKGKKRAGVHRLFSLERESIRAGELAAKGKVADVQEVADRLTRQTARAFKMGLLNASEEADALQGIAAFVLASQV
jgi:hypothetical protein